MMAQWMGQDISHVNQTVVCSLLHLKLRGKDAFTKYMVTVMELWLPPRLSLSCSPLQPTESSLPKLVSTIEETFTNDL